MRIGVLGGIGPEATGRFYLKLIAALQASGKIRSNTDFPQLLINSIPAPELVGDSVSEADLQDYVDGVVELDRMGVDMIVMVCNTIHLYHAMLQRHVDTPILDLRAEVRKRLKGKVAVVGTSSTVRQGLYTFADVRYANPDATELEDIGRMVCLFNKGVDKQKQVSKLMKLAQKRLDAGAECIVLACTELAVMLEHADIPKVDTLDVLVDAVAQKALMQEVVAKT